MIGTAAAKLLPPAPIPGRANAYPKNFDFDSLEHLDFSTL